MTSETCRWGDSESVANYEGMRMGNMCRGMQQCRLLDGWMIDDLYRWIA